MWQKTLAVLAAASLATAAGIPEDRGAAGLWQALKRSGHTARVLYLTAHPDDEDAGTLTWLARGYGADVTLLSITRGEGGANLITGDFFDALALLRELELQQAAAHYGVRLRFTSFQDFGYSKNVAETWRNWDKAKLLAEVLRVIEEVRPHVLIAKFHGSARDGHGHHTASGEIAKLAYEASQKADWKIRKLYTGNWQAADAWTVRVDAAQADPVLGRTYQEIGLEGYRWHRSQGMDRMPVNGFQARSVRHYKLEGSTVGLAEKEETFFDRLETDIGLPAPAREAWEAVRRELRLENPGAALPALERFVKVSNASVRSVELLLRAKGQWHGAGTPAGPGSPLSVRFESEAGIVPKGQARYRATVVVRSFSTAPLEGMVRLDSASEPAGQPFRLSREGEEARLEFTLPAEDRPVRARAEVNGQVFDTEIRPVTAPGLPVAYLRKPALHRVRVVDVRVRPGLKVGYVMGTGDQVPEALRQLGVPVELVTPQMLATGDLSRFTTIIVGIRGYAARPDLREHNARLLAFAEKGGVVIVQYNTQEYDQNFGPYPYTMTARAEEVSEEKAAVRLLDPAHPVWLAPNRIEASDFDGWLEQRGSKFWMTWDARYTPLLESHDEGQPEQKGGWLEARHGRGLYIYCAYAWYRQLPAAVPGAVRIFANLVSRRP